jgi:hypothetical protein
MKIKIENDVFDIVKRIKDLDEGYFILFDTTKKQFEVHNKNQNSTYCLTVPFGELDKRLVDLIKYSNMKNIDKIIEDIDRNNIKLEQNMEDNRKSQTEYMVNEIYQYCNNSSKEFTDDAFSAKWR